MIVIAFGEAWNTIDASPFVVKLLTWLRMAGLPFTVQPGDLRKTPANKVPAVVLDDGRTLGDSQAIIDLLAREHGTPVGEQGWSAADLATARAWRALLETDIYFCAIHQRWVPDDNFAILEPFLRNYLRQMGVPGLLRGILPGRIRAQVRRQLMAQGTGRRPEAQILENAIGGYAALSEFMGDRPYFFGSRPAMIDATVFAFLHTQLLAPFRSPIRDFVASRPNLVSYQQRLLARYWPERTST